MCPNYKESQIITFGGGRVCVGSYLCSVLLFFGLFCSHFWFGPTFLFGPSYFRLSVVFFWFGRFFVRRGAFFWGCYLQGRPFHREGGGWDPPP